MGLGRDFYPPSTGTSCRLIDGLLEWGCQFQRYLRPVIRAQIRARWENCKNHFVVIVVQLLSPVWLFVTPWTAAHQAPLRCTISQSLLKLMSIEPVMRSNRLILCHPLLLLPSSFPRIKVFSSESSALRIRWPKYWSFSFNVSPSNEYSGLISFRIEWFDLLAVQGSLKSLFQHHSWKTSVLRCSAFFIHHMSQQSHSWAWVRKRQRPYFKKIHAPQCSLQHYLK